MAHIEQAKFEEGSDLERENSFLRPFGQVFGEIASDLDRSETQTGFVNEQLNPVGIITGRRSLDAADAVRSSQTVVITFKEGDPENPQNWSKAYKWYVTMLIGTLCFAVTFSSSVVTGDLTGSAAEFGVSVEVSTLQITFLVMGFGIGPMVFAPLSELYGRQWVYLSTFGVYVLCILPCALAPNIQSLLAGRAVGGIASSAPICIIGGTIADLWDINYRIKAMAVFAAAPLSGPVVGPIVGGFIGETVGWRWIYWVVFIFSGVMCILLALTVPETHEATILLRRAKKLRKETGNPNLKTETELYGRTVLEELKIALTRPFQLLLSELIVTLISLYLVVIYGLLYMFFVAYPVVFGEGKGFSPGIVGLMFIPVGIGMIIGVLSAPYLNKIYLRQVHTLRSQGIDPPPELRLVGAMAVTFIIPPGLFKFAWTSYPSLTWWGPALGGIPFGIGVVILYLTLTTYLVASAVAAKTLLRSLWGAVTPLFTVQMYHNLGYEWAGSVIAFIALAVAPIPFVFYFYGANIRKHSKYAKTK